MTRFGAELKRLPDVGVNGQTGQEIPPSRMNGRTEPRLQTTQTTVNTPTASQPTKTTGAPLTDRKCPCGALLPKKRRFCDACRLQRRHETLKQPRRH